MTYNATRRVESSVRTFAIVEHLEAHGPDGISAIARELDMSKGIVHNHVSTLRELGYVTKRGAQYQLSSKFVQIGQHVQTESAVYQAANSLLDTYAERMETGVVCLQQAGDMGIVTSSYRLSATHGLAVGTAIPLSRSLLGVILLIEAGESPTASSTYDTDAIAESLTAKEPVHGELTADSETHCIAFPITDNASNCHGSVGIILPVADHDDQRTQLDETVKSLRARIETRLTQDDTVERSFTTEKHSWIDG